MKKFLEHSFDFPIDFVVSWVDGEDEKWVQKKNHFTDRVNLDDPFDSAERYREIGTFQYWFRSVEKYAPWVNHIYVITDNQVPNFLNDNVDKVTIIDHSEIIDGEFLPTFNSSTIEMNIHKIDDLVEHFVYFNDDMYLNSPVGKDFFFSADGKVKDIISQSVIMPIENYDHNLLNNTKELNKHFVKRDVLKHELMHFFSFKQGAALFVLNLILAVFPRFTRLFDPHTAYSIRKSAMREAVALSQKELDLAFSNRTRGLNDLTIQWIRYYQIASGYAVPRSVRSYGSVQVDDIKKMTTMIQNQRIGVLNIQDSNVLNANIISSVIELMNDKFPEKSSYEK